MLRVFSTNAEGRLSATLSLTCDQQAGRGTSVVQVYPEKRYQTILGFGAAFTDGSCYMMDQLASSSRSELLHELFAPEQHALNVCRTCVGSSDYARVAYSYDDTPDDWTLRDFNIDYDRSYILPVLRQAREINPDLFLFSSPWSPPGWMKTGGSMYGGWMRRKYLEVYARYYLKYLQAYAEAGVPIYALTPQNETETDQLGKMPACYWHPDYEMAFVRDYLGPLLFQYGMDTQIWLMDHNYDLWKRAKWMLDDPAVRTCTEGVAFHGYGGTAEMMSHLHEAHPECSIYWTEGGPDLSSSYQVDWCRWSQVFTEALRNWSRCITAWNLALDEKGTPNIGPFPCAGLVTIHSVTREITYSGQFWAIGQFSRFIQRGAVRIGSESNDESTLHVAFTNPDGNTVVVLTNPTEARKVRLQLAEKTWQLLLPADSVSTIIID